MPNERHLHVIDIEIEDAPLERLKSICRAQGHPGLSGHKTILKCLDLFLRDEGAVKLLPPERKEIETRTGAAVPIRSSKDILRAFERAAGGPTCVLVDLDPGVASELRDLATQGGFTFAEFAKNVLETATIDTTAYRVETKPLFFTGVQWKHLLSLTQTSRIRSAEELLTAIAGLKTKAAPAEADPAPVCPPMSGLQEAH